MFLSMKTKKTKKTKTKSKKGLTTVSPFVYNEEKARYI